MRRPLLLLPLLAGCGGTLTVEGMDPFGPVWSGSWMHYRWGDGGEAHTLQLTNVTDACEKLGVFYEAERAAIAETAELPLDGWCAAAEEPFRAWATAGDALVHEGAHYLTLAVSHDGGTRPVEGAFTADGEDRVAGQLVYVQDDPYRTFLEDWDPSADVEDQCGVDGEVRSDLEAILANGRLDLQNVADEEFAAGRLEGGLTDADGVVLGEVDATFRGTWCPVDMP